MDRTLRSDLTVISIITEQRGSKEGPDSSHEHHVLLRERILRREKFSTIELQILLPGFYIFELHGAF
jgi:hypothetical protein